MAGNDPMKKVGPRQQRKRAKKECDKLFSNVSDVQKWCDTFLRGHDSEDTMPGDSGSVPNPLSFVPSSPAHSSSESGILVESASHDDGNASTSSAASESAIVVAPTRLNELYSDSDDSVDISSSEDEMDSDLCSKFRECCVEHDLNHTQIKGLLKVLKPHHPELPLDPRTLLETPTVSHVKQLGEGSYVHIGVEKGLITRLKHGTVNGTTSLGLDVNFDGLQLSQSGGVDCWPILVKCVDLNLSEPFCAGVYCGPSKPSSVEEYLHDYIQEVKRLMSSGVELDGVKYDVFIRCYICDAPARAFIKCIMGHTSYFGCERCLAEGDHDGSRVIFNVAVSTPRTDESFNRQDDENHHQGVSPLTALGTSFVTMFVLDHMHLIFHGVFKRFLQFLLQGKCKSNARLSASEILAVSAKVSNFADTKPHEFARPAASLTSLPRWKATELRIMLLYVGIVAFYGEISEEIYSLFLLLHVGCRILFSPSLLEHPESVNYAENLFAIFIKHSADKSVFGPGFVVYNTHSLLHICDDVRRYGCLADISAFPFENYMRTIKRMVRSGVRVPQQIARRLAERDNFIAPPLIESATLSPCDWIESSQEFKLISCDKFMLTRYTSQNSYFQISGGSIGQVKKIVKDANGSVVVLANVCSEPGDFYTYPLQSSIVGVYKFSRWSNRNVTVELSMITGKFMVIPLSDSEKVAILMLHTF